MQRRLVLACAPWMLAPAWAASLTEVDANAGIRAALERGAGAAVASLGRTDGFMGDPRVKIELPGALRDGARLLRGMGQGARVDELVLAMNRAAEAAVPVAKPVLLKAVRDMSVEDGLKILKGGDDSVTRFFETKTREPLFQQFLPIVTEATRRVSLADKYNAVAKKAATFGLVKGDEANAQQYVTQRALDGLFLLIGEEEKKIRRDPVGSGSALLKKVFGGL
ncbi:MAG: DUF4197 domain-containing protein [Roseateles depolymerans]|uniref:DUF4197 domain-containing protein n=1 Tax=Roseateles depolymerans TaxID=76731 RepID=A0A2W5FSE4_9BURK|nr:MAG: DUF4197 domain-containing protein [Roseateles depolymerans]